MGSSVNDFSDRRRSSRRGERPGMGPGGGSREGYASKGRPGRGPSDPRRPSANTLRRRGPRPDGPATGEPTRWTRDREERPSGEVWRRGEGSGRQSTSPEERPKWRVSRREDRKSSPSRPFRPSRPTRPTRISPPSRVERPTGESDLPRGDAHAGAAPSDLIWGRHAAQAALESERPIHRIWCTPEMRFRPTFLQLLREAKASGVLVEEVTWARLGQLSGGAVHQGIVLQPAAADTLDLPTLIDGCRQLGENPLLVAVDGLTDPQNLGAILRSAEALGVHGLVLPQRRNAGLTGSVAKVAAGALEHLPVARVVNLNRALDTLRQEGYRVVGLDPQGTASLEEADLEGPLVVITGSEGQGLSLLTRKSCDQLVRIPLRGSTPSLNASVATALVLYEVARRGWMRGLRGTAKPPRLARPQVATEPAGVAVSAPPPPVSSPPARSEEEVAPDPSPRNTPLPEERPEAELHEPWHGQPLSPPLESTEAAASELEPPASVPVRQSAVTAFASDIHL
ncbi:MAG: 23S rRNA (guanosine(2251)-2'-O)-methyltransferase RlmB [Cyanobacteriota bacterium]|nr:23S rRNA (guanosine(2251)-2'-O)-methyltransferase RlmB [Cyanobacteriota bacterium]